jgi:hypothetical protein
MVDAAHPEAVVSRFRHRAHRSIWGWGRASASDPDEQQASLVYRAYASRGGVVDSTEFSALLRAHSEQPISQVARWIVAREVVQFWCHGETQFPLFQFDLADMSLRPRARQVIQELSPAFDDLGLAHWFIRPNSLLADAAPVDHLAHDPHAVVAAARADRFVMLG